MTLRDALLRGRRRPRSFGAGSPVTYRGDGYEFAGLRAYVPGDDVRRIDWAATARAGGLQTRVVLEDVALTLAASLDTSASMRVGRKRTLLDAGYEALRLWYGAALSDDRCIRVGSQSIVPPRALRGERSARAALDGGDDPFDVRAVLETAAAALARGTAYLLCSDFHDVHDHDEALLMRCAARLDCTALVARDPWYDALPLRGFVRLRGAEGGGTLAYIGARERERYARAVREREARIVARLERCGWRVGILNEAAPGDALADAFALHSLEVAR